MNEWTNKFIIFQNIPSTIMIDIKISCRHLNTNNHAFKKNNNNKLQICLNVVPVQIVEIQTRSVIRRNASVKEISLWRIQSITSALEVSKAKSIPRPIFMFR